MNSQTPEKKTKRKTGRDKYYEEVIYSKKSQFEYKDGTLSCTFCCLEACKYLFKNKNILELPREGVVKSIDEITKLGVDLDPKTGLSSCDEAFSIDKSCEDYMVLGDMISGRLIDSESFLQVLNLMITKHTTVACFLTKPIETILIFYEPTSQYPFVIFDSHGRFFELELFGSGFYFFPDEESCRSHLRDIFKIRIRELHRRELLDPRNMFEATLIHPIEDTNPMNHERNVVILNTSSFEGTTSIPKGYPYEIILEESSSSSSSDEDEEDAYDAYLRIKGLKPDLKRLYNPKKYRTNRRKVGLNSVLSSDEEEEEGKVGKKGKGRSTNRRRTTPSSSKKNKNVIQSSTSMSMSPSINRYSPSRRTNILRTSPYRATSTTTSRRRITSRGGRRTRRNVRTPKVGKGSVSRSKKKKKNENPDISISSFQSNSVGMDEEEDIDVLSPKKSISNTSSPSSTRRTPTTTRKKKKGKKKVKYSITGRFNPSVYSSSRTSPYSSSSSTSSSPYVRRMRRSSSSASTSTPTRRKRKKRTTTKKVENKRWK